MALSSNLTTFSDVTDGAPLSPAYLSGKFGVLDKNILQVNQTPNATNVFHIEDPAYGAVGGDTGDQSTAINAAATAAIAVDGMVIATPGVTYRINGTVDFTGLRFLDMTGSRFNHVEDDGTAVKIGGTASTTDNGVFLMPEIDGHKVAGTPSGVGLLMQSMRACYVRIPLVSNFSSGVQIQSAGASAPRFVDCIIDNQEIISCLVGVGIEPTVHDDSWCNQSIFRGGKITMPTGESFAEDAGNRCLRAVATGNSGKLSNWLFEGVSFEGPNIEEVLELDNARNFRFSSCRWESATTVALGSDCENTVLEWGVGLNTLVSNGTLIDSGKNNLVLYPEKPFPIIAGPFTQENVAEGQSDVELTAGTQRWMAPRAGSLTGIVVKSTEARTAGTLTIKGAKATGLAGAALAGIGATPAAILNGTNTSLATALEKTGVATFAAGDEITARITTNSSWTPITADVRVWLEISLM